MSSDLLERTLNSSILVIYPGNLSLDTSFLEVDQFAEFIFILLRPPGPEIPCLFPFGPLAERVNVRFGKTTNDTKSSVKLQTDG